MKIKNLSKFNPKFKQTKYFILADTKVKNQPPPTLCKITKKYIEFVSVDTAALCYTLEDFVHLVSEQLLFKNKITKAKYNMLKSLWATRK
jgi:hypothetical protein